jgi:hypothetical protein
MAFIEDVTKGSMATVLVGIGVALAAPTVLPALASGLRPLAKAVIKGGVLVYDAAKEAVAEAGEQFNDLVAEARTELAESGKAEAAAATGAGTETQKKSH